MNNNEFANLDENSTVDEYPYIGKSFEDTPKIFEELWWICEEKIWRIERRYTVNIIKVQWRSEYE